MNDTELRRLAEGVVELLRPRMEGSEPLRRTVGLIGKWLCEISENAANGECVSGGQEAAAAMPSEQGASVVPPSGPPVRESEVVVRARVGDTVRGLPVAQALVPLKIGDAKAHVPLMGTTEELGRARAAAFEFEQGGDSKTPGVAGELDLKLIEERCRLKAASCRLFIERRAAEAGSEAERGVVSRMNEMLTRAKAMPGCFLWVFWRHERQPDDAALSRIAACYDAQAEGAALVRRMDEAPKGRRPDGEEAVAMGLLAEANSALRVALLGTWLTEDDKDQLETHLWLRRETASRRVFIPRFMSMSDPADPAGVDGVRARIADERKRFDDRTATAKGVKNALGHIRYHAGQIVKNRGEESARDWSRIEDAARELEGMGVALTDTRIAGAVGPAAAALWRGEPADGGVVSGIVSRALAIGAGAGGEADDPAAGEVREWSGRVMEVRELLRGKRMVIIGGEPNVQAIERLTRAFELEEAEWVELTEHGSGEPMRAPINRPDTAVVVVIVKLTGHLHADEARGYASAAGKPCVLLSGGYNPERVAAEVLEQASARLGERGAPV